MKNIGYEYVKYLWVLPEYIYAPSRCEKSMYVISSQDYDSLTDKKGYTGVKNDSFRIYAKFSQGINCGYYSGQNVSWGPGLKVEMDGRLIEIKVVTSNLLSVVSDYGYSHDGFLDGRFKLMSDAGFGIFMLVPEDTRESEIKSRISEIYHDKTIKFTKKMIPGHAYVTKSKRVLLYIGEVDHYSVSFSIYYNILGQASGYRDTPCRLKLFLSMSVSGANEAISKLGVVSVQDIIRKKSINPSYLENSSLGYAGKDLGPVLTDDGSSLYDCVDGIEEVRDRVKFMMYDKIFENEYIKQYLKDFLNAQKLTINPISNAGQFFKRVGV